MTPSSTFQTANFQHEMDAYMPDNIKTSHNRAKGEEKESIVSISSDKGTANSVLMLSCLCSSKTQNGKVS